mgnify:CR=1 FL=1
MKVGVLGYGMSAKTFHIPLLDRLSEFQLCAISTSKTYEVLKDLSGQINSYPLWEELLEKEKGRLDLIIVTLPNHLHFKSTQKALEKGFHVLVEKPFVITPQEVDELKSLAKEVSKEIFVYHNRRFDSDYETVKKWIVEEKLGKIHTFYSFFDRFKPLPEDIRDNWRLDQKLPATGFLWDLGSHLIDQALELFGRPKWLWCRQRKLGPRPVVDDFEVIFSYPDKDVHLCSSMLKADFRDRFLIHGDRGSLRIQGTDPQEAFLKNNDYVNFQKNSLSNLGLKGEFSDHKKCEEIELKKTQYLDFYRGLLKSLQTGQPFRIKVDQAKEVVELICRCEESSKQGEWIELSTF